ncbi:dihydroneopterin aldolase [Thiobacillus sp.]|uniref:dihydroneopterin aldolase n=1 Tax=Thiobacillus sp. TaxID=924 RepID=UPI0025E90F6F|nr:dihydroneopterin aldolase [Thiobacillus sp.]
MNTGSIEFLERIAVCATDAGRSRTVGDDRIFVRGLRVDALIGVYEYERQQRQPLLVDLELELDGSRCCHTDDLGDAVDYAAVVAAVHRLALFNRRLLLEAFAQDLADTLINDFALNGVAVNISKPGILEGTDQVGVSIRRRARDAVRAA